MMPRRLRIPLVVQLFLTNSCNLKCEHCFAEEFKTENDNPELTDHEWISLATELRRLGVFELSVTGGEAFARRNVLALLTDIASLEFPRFTIYTNGTLITPPLAEALTKLRIKQIVVSIDGTEATHDRIRGVSGAFNRALEGVRMLVSKGVNTRIEFTAMRHNYTELPALVELVMRIPVSSISVNKLYVEGRCTRERYAELSLRLRDSTYLSELVASTRKKFPTLKLSYQPSPFEKAPTAKSPSAQVLHLMTCGAAYQECAVTPTGWVLPCAVLATFRAGNIRRAHFADIWENSSVLKQIRDLHEVTIDQVPLCRECPYAPACGGGCRGSAYNMYGDILAPDPECPVFRPRNPALVNLMGNGMT